MGAHTCLSCGLRTGRPELHQICDGAPPRWEVCTCGSGGHPRRCDLHPGAYEAHVRELNEENEKHELYDLRHRILAAIAIGEEDGAVAIYEIFDELHSRGAFDVADRLLAEEWGALSTLHVLAILSITLPAAVELQRREAFRAWAVARIEATEGARATELLRGL